MNARSPQPILFILCGLPFSGKSTLGRALAAHTASVVVRFDDTYAAHAPDSPRIEDAFAFWQTLRDLDRSQIGTLLRQGHSVVYDNTNFLGAHRSALRAEATACAARPIVVYANTPIAVIDERRRTNTLTRAREDIADADLRYLVAQMEEPTSAEPMVEFRPGMDLARWLADLQREVIAKP